MKTKTLLKHTVASAALTLLLCVTLAAQEREPLELNWGSRNVSFTPPPGCRALAEEKLAAAFKEFPFRYGCATPSADMTVVVLIANSDESRNALSKFERGFKAAQMADADAARTLRRRVTKLGGNRWVNLRFRQGSAARGVAHDVYMADWAGPIILFDFFAPASKFEAGRVAIEESVKSIVLSLLVNAPVEQDLKKN